MKKLVVLAAALLLTAACAASLAGPKSDIRRLEKDCNEAYAANVADRYFGYYTEDAHRDLRQVNDCLT